MNAFTAHGAATVPDRAPRKPARAPSALELKLQEKQRLSRSYRIWRRADRAEVLSLEPRLRDFLRYLRSITPETADELVEQIATSWLMPAQQRIRLMALELVSRHCDRINRQMGFEPLDDPIPPETSLYFRARDLLHAEGRA